MFERFTDRARRVLVLAQEEARLLNHSFIGTEHILLGLIHEGEGVAAKALESMGISLEAVREKVEETIGMAGSAPSGSPPFTPRAKKVLELSLREALQLGHSYIGTEHMLLGLVREGEGVAAQVLVSLGVDLGRVRAQVIQLMSGSGSEHPSAETEGPMGAIARAASRRPALAELLNPLPVFLPQPHCSFCGRDLWESDHVVSYRRAVICSTCIEAAHRAIEQAAPADQEVFLPPRVFGRIPSDRAVDDIATALQTAFRAGRTPEELRLAIEDFDELHPFLVLAGERFPVAVTRAILDRVRFIDDSRAAVRFRTIFSGGGAMFREGQVVLNLSLIHI